MPYHVRITDDAENDIEEIGEYIAKADSPMRAAHVIAEVRAITEGLHSLPNRGTRVQELEHVGRPGYREVLFKPYRIVYQVTDEIVDVLLIADGRRDMNTLLMRRLLQT